WRECVTVVVFRARGRRGGRGREQASEGVLPQQGAAMLHFAHPCYTFLGSRLAEQPVQRRRGAQQRRRRMQIKNPKDFWAGLMFIAFGVAFVVIAAGTPEFINRMFG